MIIKDYLLAPFVTVSVAILVTFAAEQQALVDTSGIDYFGPNPPITSTGRVALTQGKNPLYVYLWSSYRTSLVSMSLPVQPISTWKAEKKAHIPSDFLKHFSAMFDNHTSGYFGYRINKRFTVSRCVICISCSVHFIKYHQESIRGFILS